MVLRGAVTEHCAREACYCAWCHHEDRHATAQARIGQRQVGEAQVAGRQVDLLWGNLPQGLQLQQQRLKNHYVVYMHGLQLAFRTKRDSPLTLS